jgi:PKD domain
MRRCTLIILTLVVPLLSAASAQAVVVTDAGTTAGVALVPDPSAPNGYSSLPGGVTPVTGSGPCSDPFLAADLGGPVMGAGGLCYHGGPVVHRNEVFALSWDPQRTYWQTTRGYVEQFLGNVANGSGSLASPFAETPQYQDASGRALNASKYGGGCVDFGVTGGATCRFGSSNSSVAGTNYPTSGNCPTTGSSWIFTGSTGYGSNFTCLTDAQIQSELSTVISETGIVGLTQPGYTPVVTLLMPPGVETCLDSAGTLCSANSTASGKFCSYHSQVNVGGTEVAYVVQPWTPYTGCDESGLPPLKNPTPQQVSNDAGLRLVSPLSAGLHAAIVNPALNAWYAQSGYEINDNGGCAPFGLNFDTVTVGASSYVIQREFNNGAALAFDPNTYFGCVPTVILTPTFVVPSAVNQGDTVEFDGSATASTLVVSKDNYQWNFGDGTTAAGPSVEHVYATGGTYTVTLTVTDRGGNVQTSSQPIQVLGANGQPVTPSSSPSTSSSSSSGSGKSALQVTLQLMPQGLRSMLRSGVAVLVTSNEPAAGLVYVSISRATAKRAHIKAGRGPQVTIGLGTVSGIKSGSQSLHLHLRLSQAMTKKLKGLGHVTLTIRLALVDGSNHRFSVDAAARY